MLKNFKKVGVLILISLLLTISSALIAYGQPPSPAAMVFYGTAKIDGIDASIGTIIKAYIQNDSDPLVEDGNHTLVQVGNYSLLIVNGTSEDVNKSVSFTIDDRNAEQTGIFDLMGGSNLNLTLTVPPTKVNLITPANNSYLNNAMLFFNWTDSTDPYNDSIVYTLLIDDDSDFSSVNVNQTTIDSNYSQSLTDNTYFWKVLVSDNYSIVSSDVYTFTLDTVTPKIDLTTLAGGYGNHFSPANQDGKYDEINITMSASELVDWGTTYIYNSSADKVDRYTDSSSNYVTSDAVTWDGHYHGSYGNSSLFVPDGTYTINTTITDKAGNSNTTYVTSIIVDATAPIISNVVMYPTTVYNDDNVMLNATITDLSDLTVRLEGNWTGSLQEYTPVIDGDVFSYTINAENLSTEDVVGYKWYANDSVGNIVTSSTYSFTVRNRAPTLSTLPTITFDEDGFNETDLSLYADDADGHALTYTTTTPSPDKINIVITNDIMNITNKEENWNGVSSFNLVVQDPYGGIIAQGITVNVSAVNDVPVISIIPDQQVAEDSGINSLINLTQYTTDVETASTDLAYYVLYENSSQVDCAINADGDRLDFTPAADWFGTAVCNLTASDGLSNSTDYILTINVTNVNDAPTITSTAVTTATEDIPYSYQVTAEDKDNDVVAGTDTLTYSLITNPEGMGINPETGLIVWLPDNDDVGANNVVVKVEDGKGGEDTQSFTIMVSNVNDAPTTPVLDYPANGSTIMFDSTTLRWNASTDADMDTITYYLYHSNESTNILYLDSTTLLNYTVNGLNDQNTYYWYIIAGDGTDNSTESPIYNYFVSLRNAPTIDAKNPDSATVSLAEGDSQVFNVTASDIDGDIPLTYSWKLDAVEVSTTNESIYTPLYNDSGLHTLTVTVNDTTGMTVSNSWTITVNNTNRAPSLDPIGALTAQEDDQFVYDVNATDGDVDINEDSLTFSDNSTLFDIESDTGIIAFTPTNDDVGTYDIEVTVTDSHGASDSEVIILTVNNTNDAPTITSYSPSYDPAISEAESYVFSITKDDVDVGDSLTSAWYVDDVLQAETSDSFTYTANTIDTFTIKAVVSDGIESASHSWTLTVSDEPVTDNYDFSYGQTLENATNVTIEHATYGGIYFGTELLNLSDVVDLDNFVLISSQSVGIDTLKYPQLKNKPAHIIMKGLGSESTPIIYYNAGFGVSGTTVCPDNVCTNINYDSATGVLEFDVTGFSTYFVTGNIAPIANAGPDQDADVNDLVTLDGSGSSDENVNDTLAYAWTQVSGTTVTLSSYTDEKPTFTPTQEGTYIFQLVVNDGTVNSQPDNVTVTAFGGILDITNVKLESVDKDSKLKPGETLTVEIDIENNGDIDIEDIELEVWFEDADGNKLKDDDNDVIEEESSFDLDEGDDESDLDDDDVVFEFDMPYDVEDGATYTVYVQAEGEQSNDSSIKYRDRDRSETIEFEREKHELVIYKAVLNPDMIKCSRSVGLDLGVRDIGEKDEDDVQLTITNGELNVNIRDTFDIEEDPDDNEYKATYSFKVSDEVAEGIYPIFIQVEYDDGDETVTETVNLEIQDCEKFKKVKEEVIVRKAGAGELPGVAELVKPPVTDISFTDTSEYMVLLTLGLIIMTGLVIFAFGAVIISLRKR